MPSRSLSPLFLLLLLLVGAVASASAADPPAGIDGWLIIDWGDPIRGSLQEPVRRISLADGSGRHRRLEMSEELAFGPVSLWHGRRVRIFPRDERAARSAVGPIAVAAVQLLGDDGERTKNAAERATVSGSQPWISLLCKFSDIADEPKSLSYFQGMYDNASGRLDHYWREVSSDEINIVGSVAIDWLVLPQPHASYVPTPAMGTDANLGALFNDCTAAADPFVDFSNGGNPFVGINMMFNAVLDCCAWGGGRFATLDGVTKSWRTTWEPPWAYVDLAVIQHEMGHGFGLPHSNNWDDDGNPYDSPWDVMSSATSNPARDATYGLLGKHTIGYHKDVLGWIPAAQKRVVHAGEAVTLILDDTVQNLTSNVRLIELPLPDGTSWYIEARKGRGVYEAALPGEAVLIFHVDASRGEDAWLFDVDVPAAGFANTEGSMWKVGEAFEDTANDIRVTIGGETADGFQVTVDRSGGLIFTDGFEAGSTSEWTSTVVP